jgi:hypothetical protein
MGGGAVGNLTSGYGHGDGSGYGSGYGSGSGSGYGHGYGHGYGYGSGDGYKQLAKQIALQRGEKGGAEYAFWFSDADGRACNGGGGDTVKEGDVQEIAGPLKICTKNALHGTYDPAQWKGERLWLVALYPPIQQDGDKIASLKRKIVCEVRGWKRA